MNNFGGSTAIALWLPGLLRSYAKIQFPSLTGSPSLLLDFPQDNDFPILISNNNQLAGEGGILEGGIFYAQTSPKGCAVLGINDHNQAVGNNFHPSSLFQKFIPPAGLPWWEEFNIDDLTQENSGWVIQYVADINNDGVILGYGRHYSPSDPTNLDYDGAVLLLPVEFKEVNPASGFDGDTEPHWLMVPKDATNWAKAFTPASPALEIKFRVMPESFGTTVTPNATHQSPETIGVSSPIPGDSQEFDIGIGNAFR